MMAGANNFTIPVLCFHFVQNIKDKTQEEN